VVEGNKRTLYHTLFPDNFYGEIEERLRNSDNEIFDLLIVTNFLCASSVMIRKTYFDRLGLLDPFAAPADDYEMWLRCMPDAKIGYLNKPLIEYVLHDHNFSHNRIKMAEKVSYALEKTRKKFRKDRVRSQQFEDALLVQHRFMFSVLLQNREFRVIAKLFIRLLRKGPLGFRLLYKSVDWSNSLRRAGARAFQSLRMRCRPSYIKMQVRRSR
jgi:hypothetical protein